MSARVAPLAGGAKSDSGAVPSGPPDAEALRQEGAELVRGGLWSGLALLASNLRSVFTLLVARVLGEAALGAFSLAWATVDVVSKVGTFGLEQSVVAQVPIREARGERGSAAVLLARAAAWGVGLSAAVALVLHALTRPGPAASLLPASLSTAARLVLAALPGIALYRISNGISRSLGRMDHDLYSRGFGESLVTVAAFLAVLAIGVRDEAPVLAAIAGSTCGGAIAYLLARRASGRPGAASRAVSGPLLLHAAPIAGYGLVNLLLMRMDVLLLAAQVGRAPGLTAETFGIYCGAVELAHGVRRLRQIFDPAFVPVVARHAARKDAEALRESLKRVGRWVLAFQLPAVGLSLLSGGLLLSVLGSRFASGAPFLALLVVAQTANSFGALAETVFMTVRPALNLFNSAVCAGFQVLLLLLLIPRFGLLGAAAAMLATYAAQGALRAVELRLLYGWYWPWESLRRPVLAFLAALAVALPVRALLPRSASEIGAGILFLAAYAGAWRLFGLDPGDRDAIHEVFRKRRRA